MALPWRDKKATIKLPVCKYCDAVAKHYSYQCIYNPKNHCKHCQGTNHTSMTCPSKPRPQLRQEARKTREKRVAVSHEWFKLNPPDNDGLWHCYLRVSPECPYELTRATIQLEHKKSKARHPELRYDVTNLAPACAPCNKLKGSLDFDELALLGSAVIRSVAIARHTSG